MIFKDEYEVALKAAAEAARIIQGHYHTAYDVEHKTPEQPVTVADREANEAIKKILLEAYPNDGWLSEETQDTEERLSKSRVWIVDPLDGTKEFINKVPEFAVSIALVVDGKPVVGVIHNPATHEASSAYQGSGAFLNGKPIRVTVQKVLSKAKILASRSETARNEWAAFEGKFQIQPCGGMAHKIAVVAQGRADGSFSLSPKTEWDFAAGVLILQEAGGRATQLDGSPFGFNKKNPRATGLVYGNQRIYAELLKMIGR